MNTRTDNQPRFFYLVPGYRKRRLEHESHWQGLKRLILWGKRQIPAGGIKIIYQHCDLLNKNGYEAYPVHIGDFKVDWFPNESNPIVYQDALEEIRETDILVCPEIIPKAALDFNCRQKISFIQGWSITEKATGPDKSYEDFGFSSLLACSDYNKKYMTSRSQLPCSVVVNGIDPDVFYYLPENKQPNTILYLNRRNVEDARKAIALLDTDIRKNAKFIELENRYTQKEMARFYQEADVFMATGYPEGFGLPALEAMACGCAVIGFTGGGGTEFMIDGKTALIASDGDTEKLSDCLKKIITDKSTKETIRIGGLNKSREFSLERMEKELLTFAGQFH